MSGKSNSWVEEEVRAKGMSDAHRVILIKGSGALILGPAICYNEGFESASRFMKTSAAFHEDCCEKAKNKLEKSKSWVEKEIRTKGSISVEKLDLLITAGGALLLAPAICYSEGFRSASKFIITCAALDDDCCEMAKNKLDEKSKSWVEEEKRTKGSINVENLDLLLIKAGGTLLLAPAISYYGGLGRACIFILKCASSDDDGRDMAKNRFEKSKSWVEMAKNRFEMSKNWAEEKIRAMGISDEHRDLAVKGGGALLATVAAATVGYSIFKGGSSSDDDDHGGDDGDDDGGKKLMKAPGRPGKFIERDVFQENPRDYFRRLHGKYP